jgi:hypothetical protein
VNFVHTSRCLLDLAETRTREGSRGDNARNWSDRPDRDRRSFEGYGDDRRGDGGDRERRGGADYGDSGKPGGRGWGGEGRSNERLGNKAGYRGSDWAARVSALSRFLQILLV